MSFHPDLNSMNIPQVELGNYHQDIFFPSYCTIVLLDEGFKGSTFYIFN